MASSRSAEGMMINSLISLSFVKYRLSVVSSETDILGVKVVRLKALDEMHTKG